MLVASNATSTSKELLFKHESFFISLLFLGIFPLYYYAFQFLTALYSV